MRATPTSPLAGRVALVTGGSSGIGAAIARRFAGAGASVALTYHRKAEPARQMAAEINAAGPGRAAALEVDVRDEASVQRLFRQAREAYGPLDVLVNNAGMQADAPFAELTLDQWNDVISTNLTGYFLCAREAVRAFLQKEAGDRRRGTVICISSVHETIPWAGHVNYAASKGGVLLLMRSLAQEVAPQGISVNGIAPGAICTDINREVWSTPEERERLLELIPRKRIGTPDDVARAAVWLASDDADYLQGATIYVDGGMALYPAFARGG